MAESSAVIKGATAAQYSPGSVFGFGQLTGLLHVPSDVFHTWAFASGTVKRLPDWLTSYLIFDLLFMTGYLVLGMLSLRVLRHWDEEALSAGSQDEDASWERVDRAGRWLLALVFGVNLVQALCALFYARWIAIGKATPPAIAVTIHILAAGKWVLGIALVVSLCYRIWKHSRKIKALAQAVKIQRFSLVLVVLLGVLAALPGNNTLEQMPDVQRAWITGPPSAVIAWRPLLLAVAAQLMLALLIMNVGRMRTRRARQRCRDAEKLTVPDLPATDPGKPRVDRARAGYLGWLVTPVLIAGLAGLLDLSGLARVSWVQAMGPLTAVLWLIALASFVRECLRPRPVPAAVSAREEDGQAQTRKPAGWKLAVREVARSLKAEIADIRNRFLHPLQALASERDIDSSQEHEPELVVHVRTVGDILAVAIVAVTGLGLIRSFTAPALLGIHANLPVSRIAVAVGLVVAVLAWVAVPILARVHRGHVIFFSMLALTAIALVAADIWLIFFPLSASEFLGVLATVVIALGTLGLGLAVLAHLAQNRQPLPVFGLLKLKSTPVLSVVVAIGLLGLVVGQNSSLHRVNGRAGILRRPSLATAFNNWLKQSSASSCTISASTGSPGPTVEAEPLILVAAAGGGIRAAWWTASALGKLASIPCGRSDVFAVSSVSGGSLGTAVVAATTAAPGHVGSQVDRILHQLAAPAPLAAAFDGLLLRDESAGLGGVNLIAAGKPAGYTYPDRSALIQQEWESIDPSLLRPFVRAPRLPWQLLFNSTAVRSGCRTIIATSTVGAAMPLANGTPSCTSVSTAGGDSALPDAYDLLTELPCLTHMNLAAAALLSARFSYITPSGAVPGCEFNPGTGWRPSGRLVEQYIDGGYIDSSGLATLADIAPGLTAAIAMHNASAVAHPDGQVVRLVVPMVVYLANTPIARSKPTGAVLPAAAEPFLPIPRELFNSARALLVNQSVLLQNVAAETTPYQWLPCLPADTNCGAVRAAATHAIPDNIVVVAPQQQPGFFAVPLGWVLSPSSESELNSELALDARTPCNTGAVYCAQGTEGFNYLLGRIQGSGTQP